MAESTIDDLDQAGVSPLAALTGGHPPEAPPESKAGPPRKVDKPKKVEAPKPRTAAATKPTPPSVEPEEPEFDDDQEAEPEPEKPRWKSSRPRKPKPEAADAPPATETIGEGPRRFACSMPYSPSFVVLAEDRDEAHDVYLERCGVESTINHVSVSEIV